MVTIFNYNRKLIELKEEYRLGKLTYRKNEYDCNKVIIRIGPCF